MKKLTYFFLFSIIVVIAACDGGGEAVEKPSIFIEDIARFEGNDATNSFSVRIKMSEVSTEEVTFSYETRDGEAKAGDDYTAASGTATIVIGSKEANISIEILSDTIWEADEDFEVLISNASNATISGDIAIVTIRNDDNFLPTSNDGYSTPTSYPNYTLTWSDEFNGTALNTADWTYETGASGWGNNELQNYQAGSSNAYTSSGKLVIEARNEGGGYTSARIITQGKQSFKYGRIDIRAKLPQGQGIWPALWMLGDNFANTGWPACGEIDIMELVGHLPNRTYGTVHWSGPNGNHAEFSGSRVLSTGVFADEYHVFSIIWDDQKITWYLDDVAFHSIAITESHLSEFNEKFFFIFNVAVGGNWPGNPDATTTFPQRMIVDYVRVFQ